MLYPLIRSDEALYATLQKTVKVKGCVAVYESQSRRNPFRVATKQMCPFFTQGFKANAPTPRGPPARGPRPWAKISERFQRYFLKFASAFSVNLNARGAARSSNNRASWIDFRCLGAKHQVLRESSFAGHFLPAIKGEVDAGIRRYRAS
jgi:hypothetical protein